MTLTSFFALYFAGIATFASPCVLPMLPLYLGVLAGAGANGAGADKTEAQRRLHLAGIGFAVGLAIVFVILGMGIHALTQRLIGYGHWFEIGSGILMMLFGLTLLGLLKLPGFEREVRPFLSRVPNVGGFGGGLLFGAGFALGWTPCVGPVLAAALTYAASATANPSIAGAMLAVYALGLATPIVAASFAASRILVWVRQLRTWTPILQRGTGALLVILGGFVAFGAMTSATSKEAKASCTGATACETKAVAAQGHLAVDALPRGPALVEFVSGHCTVCKRMRPIVTELERKCSPASLVLVDVDDVSGKQLAAHYGVSMVPTFISIDHAGGEVERIVGEQSKERLVVAFSDVRGEPCQTGI
ncbi:MAG: cytochrome c biogenesis protein CcdA [Polyangiaceae bacterium]